MIFSILGKLTGLENSENKRKPTNLKNFETSLKNCIGDKLYDIYKELYYIYKSRNHSVPPTKKLKIKKNKSFKKKFLKKIIKNNKLKKKL